MRTLTAVAPDRSTRPRPGRSMREAREREAAGEDNLQPRHALRRRDRVSRTCGRNDPSGYAYAKPATGQRKPNKSGESSPPEANGPCATAGLSSSAEPLVSTCRVNRLGTTPFDRGTTIRLDDLSAAPCTAGQ